MTRDRGKWWKEKANWKGNRNWEQCTRKEREKRRPGAKRN